MTRNRHFPRPAETDPYGLLGGGFPWMKNVKKKCHHRKIWNLFCLYCSVYKCTMYFLLNIRYYGWTMDNGHVTCKKGCPWWNIYWQTICKFVSKWKDVWHWDVHKRGGLCAVLIEERWMVEMVHVCPACEWQRWKFLQMQMLAPHWRWFWGSPLRLIALRETCLYVVCWVYVVPWPFMIDPHHFCISPKYLSQIASICLKL